MSTPYPRRLDRVTLRLMRSTDAEVHAAYRSDPVVAALQLWDVPYPVEKAREALGEQDGLDDVRLGDWTTFAVEVGGQVVGDVVCHVDGTGGVAELGYTLARAHQGHGYAREAAWALVDDLVERIGVGRVYGELDPTNVPSMRVLESVGMRFEAVTLRSFLWRGVWSDNMSYGLTAEQWRAWRDRPRSPFADIRLVRLDATNRSAYSALEVHHTQEAYAGPAAEVLAAALFPPLVDGRPARALLRGIEADGAPAGLALCHEISPGRWQVAHLMVDRALQGRGAGRAALALLGEEEVAALGGTLSPVAGRG